MRHFLLGAALVIGVAKDSLAQARSGSAAIDVTVPSSDLAHVEARYLLTSSPLELRLLARPCASIENVRFERDDSAFGLTAARGGPWTTYRDTTTVRDTVRLVVRYDVKRGGTGTIPLMHPASPLAAVGVTVRFDDRSNAVIIPQMTRQAPGEWSARYVAVPSFIRVSGSGSGSCEMDTVRGDTGGLVWRFFLLVGIMAAWVPLYLAWARRSGESA